MKTKRIDGRLVIDGSPMDGVMIHEGNKTTKTIEKNEKE